MSIKIKAWMPEAIRACETCGSVTAAIVIPVGEIKSGGDSPAVVKCGECGSAVGIARWIALLSVWKRQASESLLRSF